MYCDLHGHSRRQDVFIYGCVGLPGKGPGYNLLSRVFPKMMSLNTPDKFSYKYSTFSVHKSKEGTGRVAMWRQMGILNSFTMEATFCGSNLKGKCFNRHFTMRDFESMGYHFCDTLLDYCDPDQSNVEFVLHGLREERRKEILEQLAREGMEVPPDTDPLDLEEQLPQEVCRSEVCTCTVQYVCVLRVWRGVCYVRMYVRTYMYDRHGCGKSECGVRVCGTQSFTTCEAIYPLQLYTCSSYLPIRMLHWSS